MRLHEKPKKCESIFEDILIIIQVAEENMIKLLRRQTIYILILFLIILTFWYLHSDQYSNNSDRTTKNLKRDYVLTDATSEELPAVHKKINSRKNKVNIYKETFAANRIIHTQKVYLKTFDRRTPIFVYSPKVDTIISAYVKKYGTWEEDLLNQTGTYLQYYPDTTLIDIGCNIGVYTLFAAKLGFNVISLDPVENNIILLSKSIDAGSLAENVTLVLNAVSDEYKSVKLDIPKDNIGGAHIVENVKDITEENVNVAETILLDDLIPYLRTDNIFIKMDVEGHEWNVLKGGSQFFQSKNVKVILMEWVHHRNSENGDLIKEHLMKYGFLPYTDVTKNEFLDPDKLYTWPENVFWIKR